MQISKVAVSDINFETMVRTALGFSRSKLCESILAAPGPVQAGALLGVHHARRVANAAQVIAYEPGDDSFLASLSISDDAIDEFDHAFWMGSSHAESIMIQQQHQQ